MKFSVNKFDCIGMVIFATCIAVFGLLSEHKAYLQYNDIELCGIYCKMAKNYGTLLWLQEFDKYYFSKSLTSLFSWILTKAINVKNDSSTINFIIESFNGIYLVISALMWYKICHFCKVHQLNSWLGFVGMFFSHTFINLTPHAQESPDNAAFLVGMMAIYFLVLKSIKGLFLTLIISTMIQPQLKIILIPIICFFKLEDFVKSQNFKFQRIINFCVFIDNKLKFLQKSQKREIFFWIGIFAFIFTLLSFCSFFLYPPYFGLSSISIPLLPVSILLQSFLLGYSFYHLKIISSFRFIIYYLLNRVFLKRCLYCICILFIFKITSNFIAQGEVMSINSLTLGQALFIYTFFQQSIAQPAMAIIIHLTFYGPLIALFFLYWPKIAKNINFFGPGFVISFGIVLCLSNGIESRHMIAFMPWFTIMLLIRNPKFSSSEIFVFFLLQILASRFYASYRGDYQNENDPYLMIWGPWVSADHYWDYAIYGLISFIIIFLFYKIKIRKH